MRLSIIIPIYNAEKYLKECLDSIISCSFMDMECILVNDGSTDCSASICEQYVDLDSRFRLLNKDNGGVSEARNAGIETANGLYLMFLDADDYLTKDALKEIENATENQNYDFIAYSYFTLYDNGKTKEEPFNSMGRECKNMTKIRQFMLASSQLNTCWGKLFDTKLIKDHKIAFRTDLKIGEDFIFVADYFQICKNAVLWNIPVYYYRQHATSTMRVYNLETRLDYTDILFEYNKKVVLAYQDEVLRKEMYVYYFRVITNLCLKFSKENTFLKLQKEYRKALKRRNIKEIVSHVEIAKLTSYKKIEGILLKYRCYLLLAAYFKCKSCFLSQK